MLQLGPWDSDTLLQGFQLSKVEVGAGGILPSVFCGCCPDSFSGESLSGGVGKRNTMGNKAASPSICPEPLRVLGRLLC